MNTQVFVNEIRGNHPYMFRSGQWASLVARMIYNERICYHVRFEDGVEDWWPVSDPEASYQFRYRP